MYIQRNKSTNSKTGKVYYSVLLCSKYREGKKVKTRTVTNLSHFPEHVILSIENAFKSDRVSSVLLKDIAVERCIEHGYVLALLHLLKQLRIDQVLEQTLAASDALLVKAMLVGKIITGGNKLCIFNWLRRETGICEFLGLDMNNLKVSHLYSSLGQLWQHQPNIEKKWFCYYQRASRRFYLYDLTGTYFENIAAYDYKRVKMQMSVGLLTAEDGFPLRIQTFSGNTLDSITVPQQIRSLKEELGAEEIILIGDRGMHIAYDLMHSSEPAEDEIRFITALTHAQIQTLIARGTIQSNLFGKELAEVVIDGKRYILSMNPELESFFEKSRLLYGKYVVFTNVPAQNMATTQIQDEYKKSQNIEHTFRDLKNDNISIRPLYRDEDQTNGHALLCMFAYAIIKSLEDKLFPFLKVYNQTNKTQLSFNDLTAELNNIKICELKIGKGATSIHYPALNPLQKEILEVLNIESEKITKFEIKRC